MTKLTQPDAFLKAFRFLVKSVITDFTRNLEALKNIYIYIYIYINIKHLARIIL